MSENARSPLIGLGIVLVPCLLLSRLHEIANCSFVALPIRSRSRRIKGSVKLTEILLALLEESRPVKVVTAKLRVSSDALAIEEMRRRLFPNRRRFNPK